MIPGKKGDLYVTRDTHLFVPYEHLCVKHHRASVGTVPTLASRATLKRSDGQPLLS